VSFCHAIRIVCTLQVCLHTQRTCAQIATRGANNPPYGQKLLSSLGVFGLVEKRLAIPLLCMVQCRRLRKLRFRIRASQQLCCLTTTSTRVPLSEDLVQPTSTSVPHARDHHKQKLCINAASSSEWCLQATSPMHARPHGFNWLRL
jgi:hypothetical protein